MSLWRSVSVSRLIRGRYFSTSFIPEDLCCAADVTSFFVFTRRILALNNGGVNAPRLASNRTGECPASRLSGQG